MWLGSGTLKLYERFFRFTTVFPIFCLQAGKVYSIYFVSVLNLKSLNSLHWLLEGKTSDLFKVVFGISNFCILNIEIKIVLLLF